MMTRLRRLAIRLFRRLPFPVQRRLARAATPNYTVGSVVLARDDADRLLLVDQPGLTGWALPGGHLERGESPEAGAVRELHEETAVRVTEADLAPAVPNAIVHPPILQVDMVFTTTLATDVATEPDTTEVARVAWFAVDELPRLTMTTARLLAHYGMGPYESVAEANEAAARARAGDG